MREPQHPRRFLSVALVLSRVQVTFQFARVVQLPTQRRSWSVHAVVQRRSRVRSSPRSSQEGQSASAPPLGDLVSASEIFVAKKKKRLEEAEQEILETIKRRDVLKAEVVAGEERLAGLQADLTRAASAPLQVPTDVGV